MKGLQRLLCLFMVLTIALLSACAGPQQTADSHESAKKEDGKLKEEISVLNERQKQVLEEMGLPTDYESLTLNQKSAIAAIEEMLCYLEQKYSENFHYLGYDAAGGGQPERLKVVGPLGTVTVSRTPKSEGFEYRDNYADLLAVDLFENAVDGFLAERIGEENVRVFAVLNGTEDGADESNILSKTTATCYVFFSSSFERDSFSTLVTDFGSWISASASGHASTTKFIWVSGEELKDIYPFNYEQKSLDLEPIAALHCLVDARGKVDIY